MLSLLVVCIDSNLNRLASTSLGNFREILATTEERVANYHLHASPPNFIHLFALHFSI